MRKTRQQKKKTPEEPDMTPDNTDDEDHVPVKLHATRNRVKTVPDIPLPEPKKRARPRAHLTDKHADADDVPHPSQDEDEAAPTQSHIATGNARPNFKGVVPRAKRKGPPPARKDKGDDTEQAMDAEASGSTVIAQSASQSGRTVYLGDNEQVNVFLGSANAPTDKCDPDTP